VLAAASVHGFALVAALRGARVGMFGRVLSEGELGTTRTGGVFFASVIANLFHAMSGLAVAVVAACAIAYALYPRLRTTSATMALIWSMACLLPFLVGVDRARLVGHYIPGSVALCVFTALILDRVIVGRTAIGIAAALAMTVSLLTATLSSVFRVAVPALFAHAPDHGSLAGDPGTKAAAWWIRQNTAPGALVYADRYAELSPAVSLYYVHRPVASAELDGHGTVSGMFEQVGSAVDVLVIGAERVPLLPATLAARFQPRAVVTVDGKPTLYILLRGSAETGAEPQRLEAGELNSRYDAHYATLSEITALPLREIQAHQRSAPP